MKKYDIKMPKDLDDITKESIDKGMEARRNIKFKKVSKLAIASCLTIVTISSLFIFREPVYANMNKFIYDIKEALGISKNIDNYKTTLNKTNTDNGLKITLNEVVLNNDELIVHTSYNSKKKMNWDLFNLDTELYINGELILSSSGGGSSPIDDNNMEEVITYKLPSDLEGDVDVKLVYSGSNFKNNDIELYINDEKVESKTESVNGKWVFEFKTNGDELSKDTKYMEINKTIDLGNGESITLTHMTINRISQRIFYTRKMNNLEQYDYEFKLCGEDESFNHIDVWGYNKDEVNGVFEFSEDRVDESAKELNFTLYFAKVLNNYELQTLNYEPIGELFVISLDKLKMD